jgi:hypothetical protein
MDALANGLNHFWREANRYPPHSQSLHWFHYISYAEMALPSVLPSSMALQPFGPWPLFQFLNPKSVRLLGQGISQWQGPYLHKEQHTDTHASSGIRTHDPSA